AWSRVRDQLRKMLGARQGARIRSLQLKTDPAALRKRVGSEPRGVITTLRRDRSMAQISSINFFL
ncbi:MAG TPA: hypothetical protein VMU56_10395, partial [Beijerinckiaceae bacterium]|nr:hypothetical protein [Beijerinckiaceae bacterium]